jgi:hypothetical protein
VDPRSGRGIAACQCWRHAVVCGLAARPSGIARGPRSTSA